MTTDDKKISSLYQQGKDQQPPAHLDNAILNAAHDAVSSTPEKKPSAVKGPFSGGWPALTAIAAVLIISVILVPLIDQETSPPVASRFADKEQTLMEEQDLTARKNAVRDYKEKSLEIKKRSRAESPAPKRVERQLLQAPQETMSMENGPPLQADSILPHSAKTRSAIMEDRISTQKSEPMQGASSGLMAFKELPDILPADKWLKKIRRLVDEGEWQRAMQEYVEFKKHFPDEKIDPVLVDQLEE